MAFPGTYHRLITPAYVGGLPATHDFINDPVGNGFGGKAPANADGYLSDVAHPNEGTYFVGFEEDGTSSMFNRGNVALAENTDLLDDLFHRELAVPKGGSFIVGGAPITDFTISGYEVYVGTGFPDTQVVRNGLIQLYTEDGVPLTVDVAGVETPVLVTAIEAVLAGGTVIGSGWQVDPVISVTPAIPAATSFNFSFNRRGNLTNQEEFVFIGAFDGRTGWEAPVVAAIQNITFNDFTFDGKKTFLDDVTFGPAAPVFFQANAIFNTPFTSLDLNQAHANFAQGIRFKLPTIADSPLSRTFDASFNGNTRVHLSQHAIAGGLHTNLYWTVAAGLEVTINATWVDGTALWEAFDLASASYRFKLGPTGITVDSLLVPDNAAPWVDSAWSPNASTAVIPGQASFHQFLSQVPLLTSPDKASDDPVDTNAIWKLIWEFETGAAEGQKVRAYAGLGLNDERFCITYNSRYDPANLGGGPDGSWISDTLNAGGSSRIVMGEGDPKFAFQTNTGDAAFPAADNEWFNDLGVTAFSNLEIPKIRRYQYGGGGKVHTNHSLNIYLGSEDTKLANAGGSWMDLLGTGGVQCDGGLGEWVIPVVLPQGATLTRVLVQLEDAAMQAGFTGAEFVELTRNSGAAATVAAKSENTVWGGTFATTILDNVIFPLTIDNVGKQYFLRVRMDGVGGPTTLHDVLMDWTDPGPRND